MLGSLPAVLQGFIPEGVMDSPLLFFCSGRSAHQAQSGDPPSIPPVLKCLSYGFYCSNNFYLNVVWGEGGRR